jgi:hypothetical protein
VTQVGWPFWKMHVSVAAQPHPVGVLQTRVIVVAPEKHAPAAVFGDEEPIMQTSPAPQVAADAHDDGVQVPPTPTSPSTAPQMHTEPAAQSASFEHPPTPPGHAVAARRRTTPAAH